MESIDERILQMLPEGTTLYDFNSTAHGEVDMELVEEAKNTVKNIGITPKLEVQFRKNEITIGMEYRSEKIGFLFHLNEAENANSKVSIHSPCNETVLYDLKKNDDVVRGGTVEKKGFQLIDWMEHFKMVLNKENIDMLILEAGSETLSLESIMEDFKNVRRVEVGDGCTDPHNVWHFFTNNKEIISDNTNPFRDDLQTSVVFIQNNDLFMSKTELNVPLDVLLQSNSKNIIYGGTCPLSSGNLRKFLKLVMSGSCSRLQLLALWYAESAQLDMDVVLNRIQYEVVPIETVRMFRKSAEKTELHNNKIRGGLDIKIKGELFATIVHRINDDNEALFKLYVWKNC